MSINPIVHILRGELESVKTDDFRGIITDLGVISKLESAKFIFIKVNLAAGSGIKPDTGCNISVDLLKKLIILLRTVNSSAEIIVAESDSSGIGLAYEKFKYQNYYSLERYDRNCKIMDLSRQPVEIITDPRGPLKRFVLPKPVLMNDFFISLSKIKTHNITGMTGILKNHFGLLPEMKKEIHHPSINKVIAQINRLVKSDLCILDGNPAMEGNGPVRGTPKNINLTIIGNNAVSTDAVMAKLIGVSPSKINYLKILFKQGMGEIDIKKIQIRGLSIQTAGVNLKLPSLKKKLIMKISLTIQGMGAFITQVGHLMHLVDAVTDVHRLRKYINKKISRI